MTTATRVPRTRGDEPQTNSIVDKIVSVFPAHADINHPSDWRLPIFLYITIKRRDTKNKLNRKEQVMAISI